MNLDASVVAGVFGLAIFLALVNERVNQFVIRPALEGVLRALRKPVALASDLMPYITAMTALLVSVGFGIDLFRPLAVAVGLSPERWVTVVFSAFVVSGGSNMIHDVWELLLSFGKGRKS